LNLVLVPIRLLIADDNVEFRCMLGAQLKYAPDVAVAAFACDGEEAVEFGRRFQPDVAVIDLHMPKLDGLAAMRQLAEASPETACLIISYEQESEIVRGAMAAGARDYLVKPFSTDELLHAIRRVAHHTGKAKLLDDAAPTATANERQLIQTALAYLRTWRTDDEATQTYRAVFALPAPDPHLLARLAAVFLARRDWRTLRAICDRMIALTETTQSA
jgi:DNA-binding NarL/FixJ family response regulator